MDLEKIAGLVKIIEDSSLTEFSYEDEELKVKMSKLDHPPVVAAGVPAAPMAAPAPVAKPAPVQEEELVDDGELVAVIMAAIYASMASEGKAVSKDGLIVRSIRRSRR